LAGVTRYTTSVDTTTTKRSAVGNAWAGWGSIPVFFSPGWQVSSIDMSNNDVGKESVINL